MTKPKFGFTYPTVTGENQITAFRRIKSEFPDMQLWSHYYNGTDLPQWNEVWFAESAPNVIFLVSVKSTDFNALGARLATMPASLRGRVFIFLHHEPDQWRSASDDRGDPAPDVWLARQIAFANLRAGASWRTWVQHWVCFTEDRYRTDSVVWENNWGDTIDECPSIDGVAFDCFNIGRSVTRAGADIFGKPLEFARREDRPLIIREFGQVVPVDTPNDNQAVADRIRENWTYAKAQNDIDGVFFGLVWYYNHNNVLVDPSGNRPGRPLTFYAVDEIMADAVADEEDPFEPDPNHPQYQAGYDAGAIDGAASRDAEVATLEASIQQAIAERDAAHNAGMVEAFNETRDWAGARAGDIQNQE